VRQRLQDTGKSRSLLVTSGVILASSVATIAAGVGSVDMLATGGSELKVDTTICTVAVSDVEVSGDSWIASNIYNWLRFRQLADQWRLERGSSSSLTWITSRPSYLKIIAMKDDAIDFILQELKYKPDHWFTALRAMTDEDPVTDAERGNMGQMAQAWLRWGAENMRRI
jgi:hypothetical protein